ncbi:MAG: hypothetical protein ACPGU7_09250 [Gammaproteobacteria bacterium]
MSPTPIRSVLMSGGQGDVVMAALGLLALQRLEPRALHADIGVYTRSLATPVAAALLPDMHVTSMEQAGRPARPRYYTSADTSWSTVIRNWFYPDWYVNFPEYRRWASFGQPSPGLMRRAQTHLCTLRLGPGMRWKQDTPAYYGLKMWAPLATAWGHTRIDLERALYASFPLARERLAAWAAGQSIGAGVPPLAVFPGAGAYQYLPPELIADCLERAGLAADDLCCWFAPGDVLFDRYQQAGLPVARTASVGEIGAVIHQARCVVAPDSFVSHLAQAATWRPCPTTCRYTPCIRPRRAASCSRPWIVVPATISTGPVMKAARRGTRIAVSTTVQPIATRWPRPWA